MNDAPVPPQNLDAEESVIGAIMLSPAALHKCADILNFKDFYRDSHARIFRAACELDASGSMVDAITLVSKLEGSKEISDVGGRERIHELAALVPASANAVHYARLVKEAAKKRAIIETTMKVQADLFDGGDPDKCLRKLEEIVVSSAKQESHKTVLTSEEAVSMVLSRQPSELGSYNIWPGLVRPWSGGRLYVLGGWTGDGKTVLGIQGLRNLCQNTTLKVGFISIEMSKDDMINRLFSTFGLPLHLIEEPWKMTTPSRGIFDFAANEIRSWNFDIVDDSGADAVSIRRYQRMGGYDLLIIDHLHQIEWGTERRQFEKQIQGIRGIAREFNIPVLALSQLRRSDFGKMGRPSLQDFRESGVIEAEASMAMCIWRHRSDSGERLPDGELVILKNRYGPEGRPSVTFDPNRMWFTPS